MTRSSLLPLLFLAACAAQAPTPAAPERVSTVTMTTANDGLIEASVRSRVEPRTATVLAPLENAWAALPAAYAAVGLTGAGALDADRHIFGVGPVVLPRRLNNVPLSRFVDCGATQFVPNADSYAVRLQIVTRLTAEAAGVTRASTTVDGTARSREMSGNAITCTSTGELERRIAQALQPAS
jgi:hypothetical protein